MTEQTYLLQTLSELGRIAERPYSCDRMAASEETGEKPSDTRKFTLRLDAYSLYLVERMAAHFGKDPNELGNELFEATINDALAVLRPQLPTDLDDGGDDWLDAYDRMRAAQQRLNGLARSWRAQYYARRLLPGEGKGEE